MLYTARISSFSRIGLGYRFYCALPSDVSTSPDILIWNSPVAAEEDTDETIRGRNKYSTISHILTSKEDEYILVTQMAIGDVRGSYVTCLLYDGCVARYYTKEALSEVRHVLDGMIGEIFVGVVDKVRGAPVLMPPLGMRRFCLQGMPLSREETAWSCIRKLACGTHVYSIQ